MAELEERQSVEQVSTTAPTTASPYAAAPVASQASVRQTSVTRRVSGNETARRVVILLFGVIQAVILLRFAFLLLDAREGNGLVSAILSFSEIFVGPFEGVFKTDALKASGSILDIASITALVGWTIIEFVVLFILKIVTRQPQDGRLA